MEADSLTAILISTFDRYEPIARWTASRIHTEWQDHPPIFFSGLSRIASDSLGFDGDPRDWMGVTHKAVHCLINRGFTHAYLILDDHPPVGKCNSDFLNVRLPDLSRKINAAHISLLGYGQHRRREGIVDIVDGIRVERLPSSYRWKFSLHPGLWKLQDLQFLLEQRMLEYLGKDRTPWNFERHRDSSHELVMRECGARCHRLHGTSNADGRSLLLLISEAWLRFKADISMFFAKRAGGTSARNLVEERTLWYFGHYSGAYPIFWSGCLRQGKVHADFEKWLGQFGRESMRESWKSFVAENSEMLIINKT